MEKEKKFMIIGVFILLISLVGSAGTYAWFTWSSTNNTNLTMSIGASSDVIFKNGNDISTNKLAPVFNYTDGESTSFTIINKSTTSFSYRISLNITSIADELKNKTLKYKLVSNNTIITEGDFSNIESTNKLYEGELSKGNISFIFYLYIDGNEENNLNMIGKSLSGTIIVTEATDTYQLTNEDGSTYTPSYSGSGTKVVKSSAPFSKFKEVRVDGVTIDSSNYTLTEGSTIVTFKESYLKTLSEGEHTLKIISSDGFASGKITIEKPLTAAQMIANLYNNSNKTAITNNSITYQYNTTHNLMKDVDGNIRYYGASPNNYIYFNCSDYSKQSSSTCELWRIIGVFEDKIKIMKNEGVGKYLFDNTKCSGLCSYGKNDWSTSRLMKLLNSGYESESVGGSLYWNAMAGTCYDGSSSSTSSCDFTSIGLKNITTRDLVSEVIHYTRGIDGNDSSIYANDIYNLERISGTIFVEEEFYGTRAATWTGKIAVPNLSDYGYAADLNSCKKQLNSYNDDTCASNNWMKSIISEYEITSGYEAVWTLTPTSGPDTNCVIVSNGIVYCNTGSNFGMGVIPTLYLIEDIELDDTTTGTSVNPYKIKVS